MVLVVTLAPLLLKDVPGRLRGAIEARTFAPQIRAASARAGVDPMLVMAMVYVESRFDPRAVSNRGAMGLMQLMPSTAREVARQNRIALRDTSELFRPDLNLEIGTLYFRGLQESFGDTRLAIAAYNGGPNSIREWLRDGGETDIVRYEKEETRRYVQGVMGAFERLERLRKAWRTAREFI